MRQQILYLFIILSFLISCGENPEGAKNVGNSVNTGNANKTVNLPLGTNSAPEANKTNEAPSLKAIVEGYYKSLKEKDEAGAKKHLSAAALRYYETEAKTEKKTWFQYVLELEEPLEEKREVRNEKIEGEKAVAEIKGGNRAKFSPVAFVKENGEWKFASEEENTKLSDIKKTEKISNSN